MNREKEALDIYYRKISKEEKIRLLQDLILDINNELAAQDQNMHPEIQHRMAEGLSLATDFVRTLRGGKSS